MGGAPRSPSRIEVEQAVARLVASESFSGSKRLQRFLAYVVTCALESRLDDIKEYNLGLSVFDRDSSFDPRTDAIVRVEARRLRRQIAEYYRGPGAADRVVITIPKGTYVPRFEVAAPVPIPAPPFRAGVSRFFQGVRLPLGASAAIVLSGAFLLLPQRRVPHDWTFEDSTLKVKDAEGRVCWTKTLPRTAPVFEGLVADKALVADVDDDGRSEVVFNHLPAGAPETGGSLLCFEESGGLRWERRHGAVKTFANRTFERSYVGRFLRRVRVRGRPYLLSVASHFMWYPSEAVLIDPSSGKVVEEYWHPGWISHLLLRDMDHDGTDEVVFAAINNPGQGLGHAAAGILKIPFSKGSRGSELKKSAFHAITGGGESAYVLFPLPDVCEALGLLPIIVHFGMDERGRIMVETPLPESGGVVYYLGEDLSVQEYRFSDNFVPLHNRYRLQHLLDHPLTPQESASLGRVMSFPAAPDGNDPGLRRFWADARERRAAP